MRQQGHSALGIELDQIGSTLFLAGLGSRLLGVVVIFETSTRALHSWNRDYEFVEIAQMYAVKRPGEGRTWSAYSMTNDTSKGLWTTVGRGSEQGVTRGTKLVEMNKGTRTRLVGTWWNSRGKQNTRGRVQGG